MHRIDDAHFPPAQEVAIGGMQIGRARSRLPVIEMNDIGSITKPGQRFQQAPAKQDETSLFVILIQSKVELLVLPEELSIVKQIDGDRRIKKSCLADERGAVESPYGNP